MGSQQGGRIAADVHPEDDLVGALYGEIDHQDGQQRENGTNGQPGRCGVDKRD